MEKQDSVQRLVAQFEKGYTFEDFCEMIAILRGPSGCPWDREQTHASIRKNFIEETYEAVEAIDTEDAALLCEELGDVLLQVGLHTQMEVEAGRFGYTEVLNGLMRKLIVRHPHVFGDVEANTAGEVLRNWEAIKLSKKGYTTHVEALQSVPKYFPALMRAEKIQKKAARIGFDWDDVSGALAKLQEEIGELQAAVLEGEREHMAEEMGDLFFSMVNTARMLHMDSEEILTAANEKFISRFGGMEQLAKAEGKDLANLSLLEMDKLWEQVKKTSKN